MALCMTSCLWREAYTLSMNSLDPSVLPLPNLIPALDPETGDALLELINLCLRSERQDALSSKQAERLRRDLGRAMKERERYLVMAFHSYGDLLAAAILEPGVGVRGAHRARIELWVHPGWRETKVGQVTLKVVHALAADLGLSLLWTQVSELGFEPFHEQGYEVAGFISGFERLMNTEQSTVFAFRWMTKRVAEPLAAGDSAISPTRGTLH